MPLIPPHAIESIRTRTTSGPRSILGFLYAIYATLMSCAVIGIGILADSSNSDLIPYVLAFMALLSVGLIVAVLVINSKNPGSLLLADLSAREYVAIRTLTQGDNISGERIERILGPPAIEATASESTMQPLELELPRPDDPSPGDDS